jgi:peptidoglycan/xylan/chitin deacetylase (PgdA/CDA1 family)
MTPIDWAYSPSRTLLAKVERRLTQMHHAAPVRIRPPRPLVTFTFDDFPMSALNGADEVEKHGGRAGFYAATSQMGTSHPVYGEMYDAATLRSLDERGHEIGAHSHVHADYARLQPNEVLRDLTTCISSLAESGVGRSLTSFAYPYGETSLGSKRLVSSVFSNARGGLAGLNIGDTDRAQLRAVSLKATGASRKRAIGLLDQCLASSGWLIFFTHDVSATPSDQGVHPGMLGELARRAVAGGAQIVTPREAGAICGFTQTLQGDVDGGQGVAPRPAYAAEAAPRARASR